MRNEYPQITWRGLGHNQKVFHPERMQLNSRGRAFFCDAHGYGCKYEPDPERVAHGHVGWTLSGSD